MLLPLLIGCSHPPPDGADTAVVTSDTAESEESEPAPLSPEEVIAQLDGFFAVGFPDPLRILAAYLDAHTHAEADCPGLDLQMNTQPEGCLTEDGYRFSGLSTYLDDVSDEVGSGWTLSGEFEITAPQGDVFGAGGATSLMYGNSKGSGWSANTFISGSWKYEGEADFLGEGFSGAVTLSALSEPANESVMVDGAISYGGAHVVDFSNMMAGTDVCESWLLGAAQTRDELGRWYQIDFSACTGCGVVSLDGAVLGESCLQSEGVPARLIAMLEPSQ